MGEALVNLDMEHGNTDQNPMKPSYNEEQQRITARNKWYCEGVMPGIRWMQ